MNTMVENQNRLQTGRQSDNGFVTPAANISANVNEYIIELEMPGVDRSGLEITAEGSELTILGRRKTEMPQGDLCYSESLMANFRRVFELGPDVDTSNIHAEMRQGILRLRLPKSEKAKPRKIEISG
jgi:HSP20 family protein